MKKIRSHLFYLMIPTLLFFTFKDFPLTEMKKWMIDLSFRTVFILIIFNFIAFSLMGLRWLYLLRLEGKSISLLKVTLSRLIGFAWSYITPGSQVGGEIFQAKYASSGQLSFGSSAVTLLQDRAMELVGNILVILLIFSFYFFGTIGLMSVIVINLIISTTIIFNSVLSDINLELLLLKLTMPVFKKSRSPYTIYKRIKAIKIPLLRWPELPVLRLSLLLTIWITPALALCELLLFFNLTGHSLNLLEALIVLGAIKISFYSPVPGAMGFFEAGIIWACRLLDIPVIFGLGFVIYSRIRDLTQVSIGLLLSIEAKSGKWDRN